MDVPGSDCDLGETTDGERLRAVQAIWLAGLPVRVAHILIGRVLFEE